MLQKSLFISTYTFLLRLEEENLIVSLRFGVHNNQSSLHFGVPNNQISLHFGVPDKQISLNLDVPNNCSFTSSGGVRSSRSLAKVSPPKTEEHWGSFHKLRSTTLLYIVHCNLYTVYFYHPIVQHKFPHNLSIQFFSQFFNTISQKKISTKLSTQFIHLICPRNFSHNFVIQFFTVHPMFPPYFPRNLSTLFYTLIQYFFQQFFNNSETLFLFFKTLKLFTLFWTLYPVEEILV